MRIHRGLLSSALLAASAIAFILLHHGARGAAPEAAGLDPGGLRAPADDEDRRATGLLPPSGPRGLAEAPLAPALPDLPSPASAELLRLVTITGVFVDGAGRPVAGEVAARGVGGGARHGVRCRSAPTGRFSLELRLPRSLNEILVLGEGVVGGSPVVSYPNRQGLATDGRDTAVSSVLVARDAARIEGSVRTSGTGRDGRRERVLITQRPVGAEEQYTGWNAAGFAMLDDVIAPREDGRFSLWVRAGEFQVRTLAGNGDLGRAIHGVAKAGQIIDIGRLPPVEGGVRCRIRLVDVRGDPVPSAWVQLADRAPHIAGSEGESEFPHFTADGSGAIEIPGLPREELPLLAAAGASGYAVVDFELTAEAPVRTIALRPTGRIDLHLAGDGAQEVLRPAPTSLSVTFGRLGSARTPPGRTQTLGERLCRAVVKPRFGVTDPARGMAWTDRPPAGRYDLTLSFGPSVVGRARIDVTDGEADGRVVEVMVDAGAAVRVAVVLPREINADQARRMMRVLLTDSAGGGAPVEVPCASLVGGPPDGLWIWRPTPLDTLVVESRNACLLPIECTSALLDLEGATVLRPGLRQGSGTLRIRVVGADRESIGAPWPLHVLSLQSASCSSGIMALESGAAGELDLAVGPGEYEIRSDRSLVEPYASTRAAVHDSENREAVLPVLR